MASANYSISRKKVVLIIAGVLVTQAMLFAAGYLASVVMRPEPALLASAQPCGTGTAVAGVPAQGGAATPVAQVTLAAPKPTAAAVPAAPQVAAPAPALTATVAPGATVAVATPPASAAPVTAAQTAAAKPAAAPEMSRESAAKAETPVAAAQAASQEASVQNPDVGPASCESVDELAPGDPTIGRKFSIQLGAFLDSSNALRLASDLKAKGYKPCVMKAFDRQGRQWTVVRLGAFSDLGQASSFARSIYGREQIVAVVRPQGSL